MLNLFRHEFFSRRGAILGWGIGLALFAAMYIAIFPEFQGELEGLANISFYRLMGIDLGSFAGFIASVVVQIMPILLGVYVIMAGTGTLAGEEDNGTLELIVAMPLHRWQIVTTKVLALALVILAILVILGIGSALTLSYVSQTSEVDVTPGQLFTALLTAWPLMLAFLTLAMFISTVTPSRRVATAILTFVYVGSYLANSIAAIVDSLSFLRTVSLFSYVNTTADVFRQGADVGDIVVLLLVALVFFLLALWGFERRNITVGMWPWQRGRVPVR